MSIQSRANTTDLLLRTHSSVRVALIEPAATFTNTTPSSSGGGTTTTLTSAGAHGLTAAVAVGASIYISAGTGWTVGFYTITALDLDTTGVAITINVAYSAGFGTPTIALINTEVNMAAVNIPPLAANSYITVDSTWGLTTSANGKVHRIRLGGTIFFATSATTSLSQRTVSIISNRNATNSQLGTVGSAGAFSTSGVGTTSGATTTGTIDTSVTTSLVITAQPAAANEIMALDRYIVNVWR